MAQGSTMQAVLIFLLISFGVAQEDAIVGEDAISLLQLAAKWKSRQEGNAFSLLQDPDEGWSRPVIGILTTPMSNRNTNLGLSVALGIDTDSMYLPSSYVSVFESAGARVAPIPYDLPKPALKSLFQQINGFVIPGGTVGITEVGLHPKFRAAAEYIIGLAKEATDSGTPFPVHGTCVGLELMAVLTAQDDGILCGENCFASFGVPLSLQLTPEAESAPLFAGLSKDLMTSLTQDNVTFNSHRNGIEPSTFARNPKMTKFWNVLSTSKDLVGREFISTMEAKQYPFTATQWHFEKPAFDFTGLEGFKIPHTQAAIEIASHMASYFVAKARANPHRFASPAAEEAALIDKTMARKDPRGFFDLVYLTGVEGKSTYQVPVQQLPGYSETDPIGLEGREWLPMSIELEMVECPLVATAATPVSQLLSAEAIAVRSDADIAEWLQLTGSAVREALQMAPMSELLLQKPERVESLTSLYIKKGHDDDGSLTQWNWEKEKTGASELELSSPAEMSEEEIKFAVNISKSFVGKFTGVQYSSFQSHVEARCLLSDDRLVGLLLLWEKYHDALVNLIQLRWRGPDFARSLSDGNPMLLSQLQQRWAQGSSGQASNKETLSALFREYEPHVQNIKDDRDGYRNFAANVCHLLDINCCKNCPKNLTPKFGAVEFRMFNTEFGAPMRLAMMIFQRMVQQSCSVPLEQLRTMTLNLDERPAVDAGPLFEFLGMNASVVSQSFAESGPERWFWFCQ